MSIRTKTKGVKMKSKVALAVVAVLGIFFVQPAEANPGKSLVIIDAYFDSKVSAPNVKCITLTNQVCTDVITKPELLQGNKEVEAFTHGNRMVQTAQKQASLGSIILLRTSTPSQGKKANIGGTNANQLISALQWVNNNSSSVGAVSTSIDIYNKNAKTCAENVGRADGNSPAHLTILSLISSLKAKNIPVFAATGNTGTVISYPGCITDTVSVGVGSFSDSGVLAPLYSFDVNTDYFASSKIMNFSTSIATAAVAAKYVAGGFSTTKVVEINP